MSYPFASFSRDNSSSKIVKSLCYLVNMKEQGKDRSNLIFSYGAVQKFYREFESSNEWAERTEFTMNDEARWFRKQKSDVMPKDLYTTGVLSVGCKLTEPSLLMEIVDKYLTRLIGEKPISGIVVIHTDTKNDHAHFMFVNVLANGLVYTGQNSRLKSQDILKELCEEYKQEILISSGTEESNLKGISNDQYWAMKHGTYNAKLDIKTQLDRVFEKVEQTEKKNKFNCFVQELRKSTSIIALPLLDDEGSWQGISYSVNGVMHSGSNLQKGGPYGGKKFPSNIGYDSNNPIHITLVEMMQREALRHIGTCEAATKYLSLEVNHFSPQDLAKEKSERLKNAESLVEFNKSDSVIGHAKDSAEDECNLAAKSIEISEKVNSIELENIRSGRKMDLKKAKKAADDDFKAQLSTYSNKEETLSDDYYRAMRSLHQQQNSEIFQKLRAFEKVSGHEAAIAWLKEFENLNGTYSLKRYLIDSGLVINEIVNDSGEIQYSLKPKTSCVADLI